MNSRNVYSSAAIVGFLLGAAAGGFVYKKTTEAFDVYFGKTKGNLDDNEFYKFIATHGFAGSAVSISMVGLFSYISRQAPVIGKYNPNLTSRPS